MTVCCCGNELAKGPDGFKVRHSPCRCRHPAGPRFGAKMFMGNFVFSKQHEERTRLGLPLETDIEKGIRKKWA